MTDNTKLDKPQTNNIVPEIAKLSKKNKILLIHKIAIGLGLTLFLLVGGYIFYFKTKDEKSSSTIDKAKSESEIIKKEFSFKKEKQEEVKEPVAQIAERNFNVKDEDKSLTTAKPTFKKYKSIPLKSDETTEVSDSPNKEVQSNDADSAVIAERIKIDPNFLIPESTYISCSLMIKFVSDVTGRITCIIAEDVYSANGSVKLIEKGTKAIGIPGGTLEQGKGRMLVIWTKLITPDFKRIKLIDTQVVGQLGEAGIDGWIDSHFRQRFGGALMLSVVRDALKIAAERQQKKNNNTVNINNIDNTKDTFVTIVEKMLDNSINIAPTMYKNQGDIIGILVGKDIDFSKVYKLKMCK
ncbi:TrbI/VirB10 family protein [Rickettsia endosymbiont of Polydrusus tereticollis]|uniref:TrbI/VirB10 family protein n=1 Tax=Rickettsia endosymbiont of Polydrusus tereticollis TaxID=3066251 RepID=UPI003132F660